jgi:hypothetical protein
MSMMEIFPTHTCFDDAMEGLAAFALACPDEIHQVSLIHALCLLPNGEPYAHAWLEHEDDCLYTAIIRGERQNLATPKNRFYRQYRVQEITRYTFPEAIAENHRSNHFGPWKPEYRTLCGDNLQHTEYLLTEQEGRPGIYCKACGLTSFHPMDVQERYCGHCHRFLVESPEVIPPAHGPDT